MFQGRNVPHDFLNLRVPIWVADMQVPPPLHVYSSSFQKMTDLNLR